ncbi:DUF4339 domain-containing protein [Nordella sp. HKS 07]|uniref:GYF domain-containing protein n=1 Tax=Nordella sp. HKS 07 TaxID=2712222 RepID=UPI0013E0F783|nr:GYF domain-containing protein [Nordella sp. HKS 07]QIG47543.1 DUF4339 domain-containing protein [Nordella sp. HKS 07]
MGWLAFTLGAVLGIILLSRLAIWGLGAWKAQSIARLVVAHLLTYIVAAVGSAYGHADGGPVQWEWGFRAYALPSLLVMAFDIFGLLRAKRGDRAPIPQGSGEVDVPTWFVHVNGQERGPLAITAVKDALAQGTLKPDDWIWRHGMQDWAQIFAIDQFTVAPQDTSVVAETKRPPSNYLIRHWRGQLSLVKSYWLNSFAVAGLLAVPIVIVGAVGFSNYPRLISAIIIFLWPMTLIGQLWLSVGIWRSAERYSSQHPRKYWGGIAKFLTSLAVLSTVTTFVREGLPQIGGYVEIFAEANEKRYVIRPLRNNSELEITGPLDFGLAQDVESILGQHPTIKVIHLHSEGGRLAEAEKLSTYILQRGLNTYVSNSCASACVNVFAAGKERWLAKGAVLGLHKPYFPGLSTVDLESISEETRRFLISRGVTAGFVDRGLSVPHESFWMPTHKELFESGLATAYVAESDVALSGLSKDMATFEEALQNIELYRALSIRHPTEYAAIIDIFKAGYEKGQTIADLRGQTWEIILPLVNKSMPSASDEALMNFYQVMKEEVEAFSRIGTDACDAYLRGNHRGFDFNALPADLQKRDLDATAQLIGSQGTYAGGKIIDQQIEHIFGAFSADAQAAGLSEDEFYQGTQLQLSAAQNCKAMLVFLQSIMALKAADRTLVVRYMSQQIP